MLMLTTMDDDEEETMTMIARYFRSCNFERGGSVACLGTFGEDESRRRIDVYNIDMNSNIDPLALLLMASAAAGCGAGIGIGLCNGLLDFRYRLWTFWHLLLGLPAKKIAVPSSRQID